MKGQKANGEGSLLFKESQIKYEGDFANGMMHTEENPANYDAKYYVYKGDFKFGKKDGQGHLLEKEIDYKDLKAYYKVPESFMGIFE